MVFLINRKMVMKAVIPNGKLNDIILCIDIK